MTITTRLYVQPFVRYVHVTSHYLCLCHVLSISGIAGPLELTTQSEPSRVPDKASKIQASEARRKVNKEPLSPLIPKTI